jgi:hypothetical protein
MISDVEVLRLHYSETIRHWRDRFAARRDEARALYDERFCRMWEFYLAASETAFRWQDCVVFQVQLTRKSTPCPSPVTTCWKPRPGFANWNGGRYCVRRQNRMIPRCPIPGFDGAKSPIAGQRNFLAGREFNAVPNEPASGRDHSSIEEAFYGRVRL